MNVLGMEMVDLPADAMVLEVVVIVKLLNEDGLETFATRSSPGLGLIEHFGMAKAAAAIVEQQVIDSFRPAT